MLCGEVNQDTAQPFTRVFEVGNNHKALCSEGWKVAQMHHEQRPEPRLLGQAQRICVTQWPHSSALLVRNEYKF